jgi:hypothetical protein
LKSYLSRLLRYARSDNLEPAAAATAATATAAAATEATATTAAATPATWATATTATTKSAARRTRSLWSRFIHSKSSSFELFSVEIGDGSLRLFITRHFHKAKSFGPASITIGYQTHTFDSAILSKQIIKCPFRDGIG